MSVVNWFPNILGKVYLETMLIYLKEVSAYSLSHKGYFQLLFLVSVAATCLPGYAAEKKNSSPARCG